MSRVECGWMDELTVSNLIDLIVTCGRYQIGEASSIITKIIIDTVVYTILEEYICIHAKISGFHLDDDFTISTEEQ